MGFPVTEQIKTYFNVDGTPLNGGFVYFGIANQDPEAFPTPVFWDAAETKPAAQPFRTIGGKIMRNNVPANVFATGDFSSTVKDSQGRIVYTVTNSTDFQGLDVVLASGVSIQDLGGFFTGTDVEAALQEVGASLASLATGNIPVGGTLDYPGTTPPSGFVFASGQTIGNAASGALGATHQRANADTAALFALVWNSTTNTGEFIIQDSAGSNTTRGASAAADFAANKRLPVPDRRGRVSIGKDNMGTAATAGRITVAGFNFDATVHLSNGGVQNHALTTAQLASHVHSLNSHTHTITHTHSLSAHTHTIAHTHTMAHTHTFRDGTVVSFGGSGVGSNRDDAVDGTTSGPSSASTGASSAASSGAPSSDVTGAVSSANSGGPSVADTVSAGSGTAHPNVQPGIVYTVIIKL